MPQTTTAYNTRKFEYRSGGGGGGGDGGGGGKVFKTGYS
jgi:hypothetical protein